MKKMSILCSLILCFLSVCAFAAIGRDDPNQKEERTSFQEAAPFDPRIDIKTDIVMVYGINGSEDRIKVWKDRGYITHLMTGASWGEYQDFLFGKWDGVNHEDAGQKDRYGNEINHGPTVPYMVPVKSYGKYLCEGVKRAIDAGAEAIYMEEPEFWTRAGYSEAFKREWKDYYNENWIPQHESPDAQYRSSKLKYYLYRRELTEVFNFIREYSKEIGRDVKCYVPTHSMINYAWWGIVSPEASLVQIDGCDGYIGQVWTGTSRTANNYRGIQKERTFESAFCEYGILNNLVKSTGKRMWYLNDPVEDSPDYCWTDYKMNWESTLTASLLWTDVYRYEVMPWASRVFMGQFPKKNVRDFAPGETRESVGTEIIPADYATELMTVSMELNNMKQDYIKWDSGSERAGVLISDTMMFQRMDPTPSDGPFGSFFGISMPLIKRGMPAGPVQLENVNIKDYLAPYDVLFMTYEGMKPPREDIHKDLAQWVRNGGVLVFIDDDKDPYNKVNEWWNQGGNKYDFPRQHLCEVLGVPADEGTYKVGKGAYIFKKQSPAALSYDAKGSEKLAAIAKEGFKLANLPWKETYYFLLHRGPYVIAAGMDESDASKKKTLKGMYVDLFDSKLAVRKSVTIEPNSRILLKDLSMYDKNKAAVVASASKILREELTKNSITFTSEGPADTICSTRIILPSEPKNIYVSKEGIITEQVWDKASNTLLLRYPNKPEGYAFNISW